MTIRRTTAAANSIQDSGTSATFSSVVLELYTGTQPARRTRAVQRESRARIDTILG